MTLRLLLQESQHLHEAHEPCPDGQHWLTGPDGREQCMDVATATHHAQTTSRRAFTRKSLASHNVAHHQHKALAAHHQALGHAELAAHHQGMAHQHAIEFGRVHRSHQDWSAIRGRK